MRGTCGSFRIQEKPTGPPREDILHGPGHLVTGRKTDHRLGQAWQDFAIAPGEGLDGRCISAVKMKTGRRRERRIESSRRRSPGKAEVTRDTSWPEWQQVASKAGIENILGHLSVGRPFPTGHGDKASGRHEYRVFAGKALSIGTSVLRMLYERTESGPGTSDVVVPRWLGEVVRRRRKDEVDILPRWPRFEWQIVFECVGRSKDDSSHPRNREEHAPVTRLGDDEGGIR